MKQTLIFPKDSPSCLFCRIVNGDLPSFNVLNTNECLAFLDHRPLFHGHCLVIPKRHVEILPELPSDLLTPLFAQVQLLAHCIQKAMDAEGTFIAINNRVSQSVPHLHVHVVPRRKKDGLKGFFWPRTPYKTENEQRLVQEKIQAVLADASL